MGSKWQIKHYHRIQMRKIKVIADLEIKNDKGKIIIKDDENGLNLSISGQSAIIFPLRTLFKLLALKNKLSYLNQNINIFLNDKKIAELKSGKFSYLNKAWALSYFFKCLTSKGY